jgi:hypothetical protein
MRRGFVIAATVALVLVVALWLAARVDKGTTRRGKPPPKPVVVAGRDVGMDGADAEAIAAGGADVASVRCRFRGEGAAGELVAMGEGVVRGSTGGAELALALPEGAWSLLWQREDGTVSLGTLVVEAEEVYTCVLDAEGWAVTGEVRTLSGAPLAGVDVNVCGHAAPTDEDGRFSGVARGGGTCEVRAVVRDGLLTRRSEVVTVSPFDATGVALSVDDSPIAGMGIAFRVTDVGARVLSVHPGTPAEDAGLAEGDVILTINGKPTAGLDEDAFIALGTGREGSRVDLQIERDGEALDVSFYRERLPDNDEEM